MADTDVADVIEATEATAEVKGQTEGQVDDNVTEGQAEEEPKTVPYERFQEVVDKVKQLEEQAIIAAEQRAIEKANPSQVQSEAPTQQFDIFKEVGLEDEDDVPTVSQLKKIFSSVGTMFDRRLAEVSFKQAHPDYDDLVGTVDEIASGKYAEPLAAAIKKNPALVGMIAQSKNPRLAAYEIAKLQKSKASPVKTIEAKDVISEAVANAGKVKSSANTQGGAPLSEKGRYDTMSTNDFLKLAHSHGAII